MERIAWLLNDRMFELDVSQSELARRLGIHRSTVHQYLYHPEKMTLETLKKVLDALNMDWDWFWQEEVFG